MLWFIGLMCAMFLQDKVLVLWIVMFLWLID